MEDLAYFPQGHRVTAAVSKQDQCSTIHTLASCNTSYISLLLYWNYFII